MAYNTLVLTARYLILYSKTLFRVFVVHLHATVVRANFLPAVLFDVVDCGSYNAQPVEVCEGKPASNWRAFGRGEGGAAGGMQRARTRPPSAAKTGKLRRGGSNGRDETHG